MTSCYDLCKGVDVTQHAVTPWETTNQVLERLHISRPTLYRYLEDGLPSHQPGGPNAPRLFDPHEVDAWVRSRCSDLTPGEDAA